MKATKPQLAYKNRMVRHFDAVWLIWSNKWGCWYRPNSRGYTHNIAEAGLFSKEEALMHYTPPKYPRSYRETEPFPLSAARRHVRRERQLMDERHTNERANLVRLEQALAKIQQ